MTHTTIQDKIERVYDMFDTSFIHREEELILHKEWNVYFRLYTSDNSRFITEDEFDYKLLSYCSYYTAKNHYGKNGTVYKYFKNKLSRWFRKEFNHEELQLIYAEIGTGCNMPLGIKFIESGLDMSILKMELLK